MDHHKNIYTCLYYLSRKYYQYTSGINSNSVIFCHNGFYDRIVDAKTLAEILERLVQWHLLYGTYIIYIYYIYNNDHYECLFDFLFYSIHAYIIR